MSQGNSTNVISLSNTIKGTYSGSVSTAVKVDDSGSLFTLPNQKISTLNTTTAVLSAGSAFTGAAELNTYQDVMVSYKSSTSASLFFDFSNDGTNWDTFPSNGFNVAANIHEFHTAVKGPRYFRVRTKNVSDGDQSYLRLYTYFGTYRQGNLPLNQGINEDADAIITRGVLVGQTDGGNFINVPVTPEGHLEIALHNPRLPFGSVHTEGLFPVFQVDAVYGLNDGQVNYNTASSGVVTTSSSLFSVSTGNSIYGSADISSRKRLRYRPGQGVVGRCTAEFSPPSESSYQLVGFGHPEDGIYIGYSGSSFGILHNSFGVREQQLLTILSGSATNQQMNITLNGVTFTVSVSNSNNISRLAYEIANGDYVGRRAEPTGSQVLFTSRDVEGKPGVFSVSGSIATGSFSILASGSREIQNFISQSAWSGDKLDGTGRTGANLIHTLGNVYQFNIQYLGFGAITVESQIVPDNGNDAHFTTLHTMNFPNTSIRPSFSNPSYPFAMMAQSFGSTGSLKVKVGSFAGFIEGERVLNGNRFSYKNTLSSVSTTVWQPLFSVLNSRRYGDKVNQSVVNLLSIGYACKLSNVGAGEFILIRDGILSGSGAPFFSRYDTTSCTLFDTSSVSVTYDKNSQVLFSVPVAENSQGNFIFSEEIDLQPGELITVAAKLTAGTATYANVVLNTKEDQ